MQFQSVRKTNLAKLRPFLLESSLQNKVNVSQRKFCLRSFPFSSHIFTVWHAVYVVLATATRKATRKVTNSGNFLKLPKTANWQKRSLVRLSCCRPCNALLRIAGVQEQKWKAAKAKDARLAKTRGHNASSTKSSNQTVEARLAQWKADRR